MVQPGKPPDISVNDDGRYIPEVGSWGEEKYRLLWYYADLFATSMKTKWGQRVYIDLFAGSGFARLRGTMRVVLSSPLLALSVNDPFDCYIFCDSNPDCIKALSERVEARKSDASVKFVPGDANNSVDQILSAMPRYSQNHKVLAFCFVDPFHLSSLRFETIKALSTRFIDFLVHIPAMDPLRNISRYTSAKNNIVDHFLGTDSWRTRWQDQRGYIGFDLFIARMFDNQMKSLSYRFGGVEETVLIRSDEKNLPLYRLGFFSRHELGGKFWRQARIYSDPQFKLF